MRELLLDIMAAQLRADKAVAAADVSGGGGGGDSISLAAKWAPREGKAGAAAARSLAAKLFPQILNGFARMAAYRKLVAGLNRRLNTVETLMSSGHWADIVPAYVPGRAAALYSRAFLNLPPTDRSKAAHLHPLVSDERRHPGDPDREACREHFSAHYTRARAGEAKVHGADTLFPHEVVKRLVTDGIYGDNMSEDEKNHLVAVWRSMVEKARAGGGLRRTIFMSDFSGSMRSGHKSGDTPYWVSLALGALGAEVSTGAFANHLMTFDSTPTWHRFAEGDDIIRRLESVFANPEMGHGLSTDFQAAMNLVLGTLKAGRVRPGEEPENIVVLTDMGWDEACGSSETSIHNGVSYRHVVKTEGWQTHIEMIRENFRRAGEDMWGEGQSWVPPRIVVWNLAASFAQRNHHATAETPGVIMLSGWSPTLFEVLQREGPRDVTALEMLRDELAHPRYDRVRAAVDRAFAAEA
jgi:hypothetical protein